MSEEECERVCGERECNAFNVSLYAIFFCCALTGEIAASAIACRVRGASVSVACVASISVY